LFEIARQYLMPEFLYYPSVGGELQRTLEEIAQLKTERERLNTELTAERLREYWRVPPVEDLPREYGCSMEGVPTDADVTIGKYFCMLGRSGAYPYEWHAVLVVDVVVDQKTFVRCGQVKEVHISSLRFLLNFDNIQPRTVFPAAMMLDEAYFPVNRVIRETTEFNGADANAFADKVGHFCVRKTRRNGESNTILLVGIRDGHSLYALQDGRIVQVSLPTEEWVLVDSIESVFETPLRLNLTAEIVRARPIPNYQVEIDEEFDGRFHVGSFYGCHLHEDGTRLGQYRMVTLLMAATAEDPLAHVFSHDTYPCMYRVPMAALLPVVPVD
jgi:hypothetical protein